MPQPLPQPQWATASASGSLQGPGAAANDERHTPSTRASDSDFGYDIYPNADRFYSAPLPHHRPTYLRARRPRAPRIHRRRQRGDGTQFNDVGPLIRILIEDDDRRRAAADDPHPGRRRLGALDGPLAPRAAHRIDGISLGLRGASTSGCIEMASKKVSLGVFSDTDTPTHSPSTWCSSSCECFSSMFALRSLASAARRAAIPPLLSTIREPRACVGSQV